MINNNNRDLGSEKMTEMNKKTEAKPDDKAGIYVQGHIKIHDPESGEVYVNKRNAIHYENMSLALARSIANKGTGFIHSMHFGNGGTSVDATGVITYLPPRNSGTNADLYNNTFTKASDGSLGKIVDDTSVLNDDPTKNKIEIRHTPGYLYTDIFVSCLLDYSEPVGQLAFDNSSTSDGTYVFDELGLKTEETETESAMLLTHVIFHPVQKALNRQIQVDYTIRIQTLTNLSSNL